MEIISFEASPLIDMKVKITGGEKLKNIKYILVIIFSLLTFLNLKAQNYTSTKIDSNGNLEILIKINTEDLFSKEEIEIWYLRIYDSKHVDVWKIESIQHRGHIIKNGIINYGEVPEGFKELLPAKKLKKGEKYTISVDGKWHTGGCSFIYDY